MFSDGLAVALANLRNLIYRIGLHMYIFQIVIFNNELHTLGNEQFPISVLNSVLPYAEVYR